VIDLLIKAGADPFQTFSKGPIPNYIAAFHNQGEYLKLSHKKNTTETQSELEKKVYPC